MPRAGARKRFGHVSRIVYTTGRKRPVHHAYLWSRQAGCCAICSVGLDGSAVIDHDHVTGHVRGLLCRACNLGLGAFRDDPGRLRRAAGYVALHRAGG